MTAQMIPFDTTVTIREDIPKYVRLPHQAIGYLEEKIRSAMWWPEVLRVQRPDGLVGTSLLKQIAMSAAIRADERKHEFCWRYKAEVSFDMRPWITSRHAKAPIPFLSKTDGDTPGRRHSQNPFPLPGSLAGEVRRPDVVIVENEGNRWPGRGAVDHDGMAQWPNLLRLVEVKFPGDTWGKGQEEDYVGIAGDNHHMTVLKVSGGEEHAKELVEAAIAAGFLGKVAGRLLLRARLRSKIPVPQAAWFEPWSALEGAAGSAASGVAALWDTAAQGVRELSADTQAWLRQSAQWLFEQGRWITEASAAGHDHEWHYLDDTNQAVSRYTTAELKAAWQQIRQQTDLTVQQLRQIDWGQVCITMSGGMAVVVLVIDGVLVPVVLTQALVGALAALVAITATAGDAALMAALTSPPNFSFTANGSHDEFFP
ncbi:VRR-NUC domain-containing protein [Paraburkholderia sp. Ac-20342]|uniref:VRR-NUC domain-containing protein n=1 Tax=Paraburkholderia sp. Ac-20342 TaxID=2703889 RepID=UPI0019803B90|nr:VRR-NUC domain-containing protein [Paraburkholderia sp. Ac-20342]MBN3850694.1 VRR-NUC domain-containing protein [Paraburkholderia sp. Ac-20342]